jgi:YesN/AraC family two-component response regulator
VEKEYNIVQIAEDTKNLTALIVEDREEDNAMMVQNFSPFFSKVYSAYNGEEGLELYKKHKPDIIITDLIMPKKDGIEMIEEIRNKNKNQMIIVVSASNDIEKITKTIALKIDGFINKPIGLTKIGESLTNIITKMKKRKEAETKAFTITIPVNLYEDIMEAASNEHISKNGMIIRALKAYKFQS